LAGKQSEKKYLDPALPLEERVECLVSQMTLREKVAQTQHVAPPIPRLDIPKYHWWNECLHGVARAGNATVFPQAIGMAASFDEDLMHRVADAISDEARAKYHQALKLGELRQYFGLTHWTPNVNIFRDPRWGRGQETYGEDPFLTSRMGVAFCKGLQGEDQHYLKVVATPKHYAVHSGPESLRHEFDAVASPRDMRETYLPAFEACVKEANAWSVMGAYNRTNGEPCCASPTLLQKILREEWGFEGYVVSDCGGISDLHKNHQVTSSPAESAALAVKEGCDLNCGGVYYPSLVEAVEQNLISEEEIDTALRRLFTARLKLGMFDPPESVPYASIPPDKVRCEKHVNLARRMAQESIVLLKNVNNSLPLKKDLAQVTVAGPNAHNDVALLANYAGSSPGIVTPFEGILNSVSVGTQVFYQKGCHLYHDEPVDATERADHMVKPDALVAVLGNTTELEGEEGAGALSDGGGDRLQIGLPGRQLEFLKLLYEHKGQAPLILVVMGGSPIDLSEAEPYADAILFAWYPGEQGGRAIADVIFGDYNPSGRLPVTFVRSLDQLPPFTDYSMEGRTYRFMKEPPAYRFGFGLSYTSFSYNELRIEGESFTTNDLQDNRTIKVSVNVTNTGDRDGDEVVQLYLSDVVASVPVPRHHLEGFRRVHLKAGESRTVSFHLNAEQFACYDEQGSAFLEAGTFRISVGGGQPDDPQAGAVTTESRMVV